LKFQNFWIALWTRRWIFLKRQIILVIDVNHQLFFKRTSSKVLLIYLILKFLVCILKMVYKILWFNFFHNKLVYLFLLLLAFPYKRFNQNCLDFMFLLNIGIRFFCILIRSILP
jgi:hypothetical protein